MEREGQQWRAMEDCATDERLQQETLCRRQTATVDRLVRRTSRDVDEAERCRRLSWVSAGQRSSSHRYPSLYSYPTICTSFRLSTDGKQLFPVFGGNCHPTLHPPRHSKIILFNIWHLTIGHFKPFCDVADGDDDDDEYCGLLLRWHVVLILQRAKAINIRWRHLSWRRYAVAVPLDYFVWR